jgi:hypothetical protein
MTGEDYNAISTTNKDIVQKYIAVMQSSRKIKSQCTIANNVVIMRFLLQNIKTDLDKLTIDDIDNIQAATTNWTLKDGTPVAESTKRCTP